MVGAAPRASTDLLQKAARIRLVLTDCDGVLTDGGVYYTTVGEEMKRFSLRDGMGVERLRTLAAIPVEIITKEHSHIVSARAAKLSIVAYLGISDKLRFAMERAARDEIPMEQVAYIGDDVNDVELLQAVGVSACPSDAEPDVCAIVDTVCHRGGGHGAFREFADLILEAQSVTAHAVAHPRPEEI